MQPTRRRILFVDDHEDTRTIISFWLGTAGYEVVPAETVREGVKKASSEPFDLYLLDSRLPDGTGKELSEKIRQFDCATPIVFYSGDDAEEIGHPLSMGLHDYVMKPGFNALQAVIGRMLSAPPVS
jgi:CheY-like chemotaxis protein